MAKTHKISGSGQIFCLLALSQCFWLLCYRPRMTNALLTAAAAAIVSGAVFLPAVLPQAGSQMPAGRAGIRCGGDYTGDLLLFGHRHAAACGSTCDL